MSIKSSTMRPPMLRRRSWPDFVGGFEVDLQYGRFLVLAAFVPSGVDVDGDQRLGFVDNDVAAAFQMDLSGEGAFQLAGNAEAVEERLRIGIEFDLGDGALGNA